MTIHPFDQQLDHVESQFNELSSVVLRGQADAVQVASARLQELAVEMLQMAQKLPAQALREGQRGQRLRVLAQSIPALRMAVHRHSAIVDQALQTVLPTAKPATYVTKGPYGGVLRQSGEFKVLAA